MGKREFTHLVEKWRKMNHENQYTLKKIAELENVSYNTVIRYFERYNIEVKNVSVSNEKKEMIEKLFKEGYGQREISKRTKISRGYIKKIAEQQGFVFKKNERYEIKNEDFFEEIDTHEKAYWLGFIYADGCIVYRGKGKSYQLSIDLAKCDESILEKLKETLGSASPIRSNKVNNSVQLEMTSEKIFKDLEKWGVKVRKSLILTFPKDLDKEFYTSFILGYFDGDGCVHKSEKHKKLMSFDITGTKEFVISVQNILIQELNLNRTKIRDLKNVSRLVYTGRKQVSRIGEWLYKDIKKEIPLQRKYEVFKKIGSKI